MAARRCSMCSINYPLHVTKCRQCGGGLWHGENMEADEDWMTHSLLEGDDLAIALDEKPQRTAVMWREECFLALGFTIAQSEALARATDAVGNALYHADVALHLARARATRDEDAALDVVTRTFA